MLRATSIRLRRRASEWPPFLLGTAILRHDEYRLHRLTMNMRMIITTMVMTQARHESN
jgi:hypothetical protein